MKQWKFITAGAVIAALAALVVFVAGGAGRAVSANGLSRYRARAQMATFPAGTRIQIRLEDSISTEKNISGDSFSASLDEPLIAGGKVVAPPRSKVQGQIKSVKEPGHLQEQSLTIVLDKLRVGGKEYEIETRPLKLVARGALVAPSGASSPAVFGKSMPRARSGARHVVATEDAPVAYGPESHFAFTLSRALELPVSAEQGQSD